MNTQTETLRVHGVLRMVTSMIATRLELVAIDVESHVRATLVALMVAFVAVVLGLIAFAYVGIAVIIVFWDTHRVIATASVLFAYVAFAAVFVSLARSKWNARPAALATTLREIELDRAAFGGRP